MPAMNTKSSITAAMARPDLWTDVVKPLGITLKKASKKVETFFQKRNRWRCWVHVSDSRTCILNDAFTMKIFAVTLKKALKKVETYF
jgi:hypothetical protein